MLHITVVFSPSPRVVYAYPLSLSLGTCVADGIAACIDFPHFPSDIWTNQTHWALGIWGRAVLPDRTLRDADRLEIYRPLKVDPKVARRERFQKQGTRAAGLFASRRKGAKPGY